MAVYTVARGEVSTKRTVTESVPTGTWHNVNIFISGCLVGVLIGVVLRQWAEPQFVPVLVFEPATTDCDCRKDDVLRTLPEARRISVANDGPKHHNGVKVLCLVNLVSVSNARLLRHTWGQRCDILLFASDLRYGDFDTLDITWKPGRDHLTEKTMNTFDYVYKHHLNDVDWFLRVDDDTFVVMENLRYFLFQQNTSVPRFYGHTEYKFLEQGFPSGGAGYVLSREALRRFGNRAPGLCAEGGGDADIEMGRCMSLLGIRPGESRDRKGRTLFYPYSAELFNKMTVSDSAISFNNLKPTDFINLDYFIYRIRSEDINT